jgi:hypothetical protein
MFQEIERLREDGNRLAKGWAEANQDRDRLREALERIVRGEENDKTMPPLTPSYFIAKEALEGTSDE